MTDPDQQSRRRLPALALAPLGGGAPVPVREARRAAVLVLLPGAPTPRDAEHLRALAAADADLRGWDGRPFAIVAGRDHAASLALAGLALPFPALADPDGALAAAAGVEAPALVVADQWGEVHVARPAGEGWLPVAEIEEWLRFLASRCGG